MGVCVKIRVLMSFEGYEPDQVFDDWPAGMCEGLIALGAIEEVKAEPPHPAPEKKPSASPAPKKRA